MMTQCTSLVTGGFGHMMSNGTGAFGWLTLLVVLGAIITVIAFNRKRETVRQEIHQERPTTAREILEQEFAAGHISQQEYFQRLEVLQETQKRY
ncbi:hypothetical protein [Loigolactobacillus backii]|uniref:Uncharacterized protein n=1 Tax=Loigolactobacillus backii TaxID=375175 RepID=A0A192H0D5_9LACO|nr:hypothetical protein [Loigolactobacillus backii]ANK60729.1 hypothetical protein AYR52_10995 [Loigolactobacillus backii]ANK61702.1 hypothetical protein AYR53_02330 [Loigolactobacillus backii]ANK65682.1 hypothetical protein AYR54_10795 [Loigolactobacillus backii]ANK68159.1 hypothetical protein AYR55_10950 [Loigolactobacillus backii]ANK69101.1 hypothetical protein AYR56_02385 [Loigolactobacillus backii]